MDIQQQNLVEDQPLFLEEFGAAKYKFDKNAEMSFYVKVSDENNKSSTVWGVGLEEAINKAGAKKNDLISLKKIGTEKVIKQVELVDENGIPVFDYDTNQPLFEEKEVSRNVWEIKVLEQKQNLNGNQENLVNNSIELNKNSNELNFTAQNDENYVENNFSISSTIINSEYQKLLEVRNNLLNFSSERKLNNEEYTELNRVNLQLKNSPELYKFAMQREIPQIIGKSGIDNLEILTFAEANKEYPNLNPQAQGFFDREKQKTVLIADMFLGKDMEQAAFVAFHELGHRGIAIEGMEKWQEWILAAYENPTIKQIAEQFKLQYDNHYNQLNLSETQRTIQATEEALVEVYAAVKTDNWQLLEERRKITIADEFKSVKNDLENIVADFEVKINEIFGVAPEKLTNESVYALLKGLDNPNQSLNLDKSKNDISYSLDEKNSAFKTAISDVMNGVYSEQRKVILGTTPAAWELVGLPNTEVEIHIPTIHKAILGKHFVDEKTLERLPEQLNNPVAIFKSSQSSLNPNGFVVLTELEEIANGKRKPVIAALDIRLNEKSIEVINISSVYGRRNSQIEEALNNDLLYWDMKKGHQVANSFGLQLPLWLRTQDYDDLSKHNVKSEKDLSQYLEQKISYSLDTSFLNNVNIADPKEYKKYAQTDYLPDEIRKRIFEYAKRQIQPSPITYLAISQEQKEEARKAGFISYDPNLKCWYCKKLTPALEKYLPDASQIQSATVQKKGLDDCKAVLEAHFGRSLSNGFDTTTDKWHRVLTSTSKNNYDTKGAYRFFYGIDDNALMCSYRIMGENECHTWTENVAQVKKVINPHEQAINAQQLLINREKAEINSIAKVWIEKARGEIAAKIYSLLPQATGNEPYIVNKKMVCVGDMKRLEDGSVIIPLYGEGKLRNLQFISPNGEKRYMAGAKKENSYFYFASENCNFKNPQFVFLAEGVATAESVFWGAELTLQRHFQDLPKQDFIVIACLDCSGLGKIADIIAQKYPNAQKIIAADNDAGTYDKMAARNEKPRNTGLDEANKIQAKYPDFQIALPPTRLNEKGEKLNTDWNDILVDAISKQDKNPHKTLISSLSNLVKRENTVIKQDELHNNTVASKKLK